MIDVVRSPLLSDLPHGFLGRAGGVSTGLFASLNVGIGSGDDPASVVSNRDRARDAVAPGATLVGGYQVHSATCVTVTDPWPQDDRPHADALVTDRPGLALSVLTADCAPVLLADRDAKVIGAAHAGWKGARSGVIEATVDAMAALGASRDRIAAAVGPCIARASYEVDAAFLARFVGEAPTSERFFSGGRMGRHHFDLEAYVAHRLAAAGVRHVETLGLDTYAHSDRFFSYRRSTHACDPDYGRQIAIIAQW